MSGLLRLLAVVTGTQRSEFTYDGFSRRTKLVEKVSGTVTSTKQFVWVGGTIAEERDGSNVVQKKFFGLGEWRNGVGNLYYARDHLGNLREMTDNSNAVRARYDYDPYGRRSANLITGGNALAADWGFTGHYYHAPSTLHLAWFRAYDANLGRWISRDPIAEDGGLNLYGYVGGDPINGRDSLGLSDDDDLDERLKHLEEGGGIGKATYAYDDETQLQHLKDMAQAAEDAKNAGKELGNVGLTMCAPEVKAASTGIAGLAAAAKLAKPTLSAVKKALKKVHKFVGGRLPKGKDSRIGSPTAGDGKKGYRLDPPHDHKPWWHFHWWTGKRKSGNAGEVPIE